MNEKAGRGGYRKESREEGLGARGDSKSHFPFAKSVYIKNYCFDLFARENSFIHPRRKLLSSLFPSLQIIIKTAHSHPPTNHNNNNNNINNNKNNNTNNNNNKY